MGLIKFLIIFAAIYYGFKLLSRIFLPFLVQYLFKKTQQNMDNRFAGNDGEREEGEVTVKYSPEKDKPKRKDGDDGEYVDFEDVD